MWVVAGSLLLGCNDNQPKRGARKGTETPSRSYVADESSYAGPDESFDPNDTNVRFGAIRLTAPEGWTRQPTQSSFTLAEFKLPRAKGDDKDGRLTVSVAGGSIQANIDRWKGQFSGALEKAEQKEIDANGIQITLVDFSGEFSDQRGPFVSGDKQTGYRMIAAIIPVNDQLHFVKAVGPEKTMEAHAEKIKTFIRSVKPDA
jgi:hypothetical protein